MLKERQVFFDAYRGIGACIIVFYHLLNTFGLQGCKGSSFYFVLEDIYKVGYLPVEFFYFTSGYFIYQIYYEKIKLQKIDFSTFMRKRVAKIYPMFLFSTFIQVILEIYKGRIFTLFDIISNILLLQCGFFKQEKAWRTDINGVTWFIVPLLICYIIFYFLVKKCRDEKSFFYTVCSIVVTVMAFYNWGLNIPILNAYVLRGILGFFLGIAFFEIYSRNRELLRKKRILVILIGVAVLLFLHRDIRKDSYGASMLITMVSLTAIPTIIIITDNVIWIRKIVENKILEIIGMLSMEIYFFHWPIMTIFMWFWRKDEVTYVGYLEMLTLIVVIVAILKFVVFKMVRLMKKSSNLLELQ